MTGPYVKGSDTSKEAAKIFVSERHTLKSMIFDHILRSGGATCDEVEEACQISHQTASARVRDLALDRRIVDAGYTRPTRSGRKAVVWKARKAL